MTFEILQQNKCHGGYWKRLRHDSYACKSQMTFSVFLPALDENILNYPALFWLSGLTCSDQNFVQKAHAEAMANEFGFILIAPDTSPRGLGLPGDSIAYDFGEGAGFYVDATAAPWSTNYQMYSYVSSELYELALSRFPIDPDRVGIFGHSMGGHGALTIALKNPAKFRSVSAFSPICAPMTCPWGIKAFQGYLGDDTAAWEDYDTCELIGSGARVSSILVDQGSDDDFLSTQLQPERLEKVCVGTGIDLEVCMHNGYDHSYFFISTFINKHLRYHHKKLNRHINN